MATSRHTWPLLRGSNKQDASTLMPRPLLWVPRQLATAQDALQTPTFVACMPSAHWPLQLYAPLVPGCDWQAVQQVGLFKSRALASPHFSRRAVDCHGFRQQGSSRPTRQSPVTMRAASSQKSHALVMSRS